MRRMKCILMRSLQYHVKQVRQTRCIDRYARLKKKKKNADIQDHNLLRYF